jgi:hypothetical protein
LMDEAEDFLNQVGPQVMAEVEAERRAQQQSGWKRIFRRRKPG